MDDRLHKNREREIFDNTYQLYIDTSLFGLPIVINEELN